MRILTIVFVSMILLSFMAEGGIAQTQSDYALIREPIFPDDGIWEINESVTTEYWDTDMFSSPKAVAFAMDYDWVHHTVRSTFMGVVDLTYNRLVYADWAQAYIRDVGTFGTATNQFKWPRSIAAVPLSDGETSTGYYDIYIADTYNDRISRLRYYAPTKTITFLTPITGNGIYRPKDVAIRTLYTWTNDTDDRVYVLNDDNKILVFNYNGTQLLSTIETPEGCIASSIATYRFGSELYVADKAYGRLLKYYNGEISEAPTSPSVVDLQVDQVGHAWTLDANGTFTKYEFWDLYSIAPICTFGSAGTGVNQFYQPTGFAFAEPTATGLADMFILEDWSDTTGIQHYVIGTDIIDLEVISNPQHSTHNITYTLVDMSDVDAVILNEAGITMKILYNKYQFSGPATLFWDGLDATGNQVPTGVYTYKITAHGTYVSDLNGDPVNTIVKSGTFDHVNPITNPCCIDPRRGNIDGIGVYPYDVDIADLTYLIAYMFSGGPQPPCQEEADVTGNGDIDVEDLSYLTNYMFSGGPEPVACP